MAQLWPPSDFRPGSASLSGTPSPFAVAPTAPPPLTSYHSQCSDSMTRLFQTHLESFLTKKFLDVYCGLDVTRMKGVTFRLGRNENCLESPARTPELTAGQARGGHGDADLRLSLPCLGRAEWAKFVIDTQTMFCWWDVLFLFFSCHQHGDNLLRKSTFSFGF